MNARINFSPMSNFSSINPLSPFIATVTKRAGMLPVKLGLVLDILLTAAAVEGSHVLHPEVIRVGPDGDGERACGCGVGVCQPHLGSPWGYGRGRGGGIEP